MRAVVCHQLGPLETLVIEEQDPPVPGEGQVLVDVRAAGVNFVDGLICQGRYQIKPPVPFVPGSEIAGEVVAIGPGVTGVEPGDRVIAFTGFGGFAEQVVVPALSLVPMPATIDFDQAATLIQSYCTVLFTLTRRTALVAGEWVLVLGAGGGVGLAATDVATALGGRVIAAASTLDKLEAALAIGAEATIAYEDEDLKVRAREISGRRGRRGHRPGRRSAQRTCPPGHQASRSLLRHRLRLRADPVDPAQPGPAQQQDPGRGGLGRVDVQGPAGQSGAHRRADGPGRRRSTPSDPTGNLCPRRRRPGDGRSHRSLHRGQSGDRP